MPGHVDACTSKGTQQMSYISRHQNHQGPHVYGILPDRSKATRIVHKTGDVQRPSRYRYMRCSYRVIVSRKPNSMLRWVNQPIIVEAPRSTTLVMIQGRKKLGLNPLDFNRPSRLAEVLDLSLYCCVFPNLPGV